MNNSTALTLSVSLLTISQSLSSVSRDGYSSVHASAVITPNKIYCVSLNIWRVTILSSFFLRGTNAVIYTLLPLTETGLRIPLDSALYELEGGTRFGWIAAGILNNHLCHASTTSTHVTRFLANSWV